MDNVCHTLVGAALAEAGLKRRTVLGSATLMIAANFPDLDVIAVPLGHSLAWRRGITHGVPALFVLPVVLTAAMLAWHRWRGTPGPAPPARHLLLLSAIGILTHPLLDWMNTYGMRWLMPLSGRWWYADTLFIVDPWIWLALGLGVWWSRRRRTETPARVALGAVLGYIALMATLSVSLRADVDRTLRAKGVRADTLVVDPVFANPFRRRVIYASEGAYHVASASFPPLRMDAGVTEIPINAGDPAARAARETPVGREYFRWTRLPYFLVQAAADSSTVTLADARYTMDGRSSWAIMRVRVPRPAP